MASAARSGDNISVLMSPREAAAVVAVLSAVESIGVEENDFEQLIDEIAYAFDDVVASSEMIYNRTKGTVLLHPLPKEDE